MKFPKPVYENEGVGSPAPAVAPPSVDPAAAPPANDHLPADTSSEDSARDFVLDAFTQLSAEDDGEEPYHPVDETGQGTPSAEPVTAQAAPQPVVTPPASQTPAAATPPGNATPPVQAAAPPAALTTAVQAPTALAAVPPEKLFQNMHEEVLKHQDVFTQKLAETLYKMSDEDADAFGENPSAVVSKVAARVHTNVVASLSKVLHEQMPVFIHGVLQANEKSKANEAEFWAANPTLDRTQHQQLVEQIGGMYNQMNPKADKATFIRMVGAMAAATLGNPAPRTPAPAPTVNVQTPGRVVRQVPPAFAPGGAHQAPSSSQPQRQLNEWERMTIALGEDYD